MDAATVQTTGAIASAAVALLALVVAAIAAGYARGQRDATRRQADAAEAQVEVMRRQVELMEMQPVAGAGSREVPYVPPWTLQHLKGDTYVLTNGGSDVEYDIHIQVPSHSIVRGALEYPSIGPRASVSFLVGISMSTPNRNVTVSWARKPDGEQLRWETVLPPKA